MTEAAKVEARGSSRLELVRPVAGQFGTGQWEILERIARGSSLAELLLGIVTLVEHQADGMLCSILTFEAATGRLRHAAARRLAPELSAFVDGLRVGPSVGSCGTAAFRRQRVVVTDIATHPSWEAYKEPFLERGLRACWSAPILSHTGELLGTLAMYFTECRGPTSEESAWAEAATQLASIALSRAQAEREKDAQLHTLEDRVGQLGVLHKAARLLHASRLPIAAQLDALLGMIPSGWRYPQSCRARIVHDDIDVASPGFVDTPWKQTAIARAGKHAVRLEVVYLQPLPHAGDDPFSPDEQTLLDSLAELLGARLERQHDNALRQAALEALECEKQRRGLHLRHMPLGYVVWDRDCTVSEWNGAAERIFGVPAEAVVGKRSNQLGIFADAEAKGDPLGQELSAESSAARCCHEHVRDDGTRLVCEWLHAPLKDARDQVIGYLSMVHDVTERKRAEEERSRLDAQLRQAQRIQALGTLAGGIAHDFNNILTAIAGHTHLGLNDLEEERSPADSLLAIQEASMRAVELVRRILMFGRYQQPERHPFSVTAIVQEAVDLLRATLPATITITNRFDPSVPMVAVDRGQIHQVIMNLAANAARAIEGRGAITITVDSLASQHPELAGTADARFDRYVRITMTDTGVGMDDATQDRIFEPFFTTRPIGQGTGLGLSVVHGIVKGHEGAIAVESRLGKGSTFRIYLPGCREEVAPAPAALPKGSGLRVMYVDDEEPLVVLATRWLGRLGYQVTGFSDSAQALDAFRSRPQDFDAVISDFSMPGLSGLDLLREVIAIRRDVTVVMSSGYLRLEDHERAKELGAVDVVLKPQSMAEFGRILHRILSERQSKNGSAAGAA